MAERGDQGAHPSFLTGVYLAVNAFRDLYLVVDGPNCVFFRAAQLQPNHDWLADLTRSSGLHRVVDTDATPSRVAQGDSALLLERLRQVDGLPDCAAILLTPMAHVALTGRQYAPLLAALDPPLAHPVIQLASGSLSGDWLDGYSNTLAAVATQAELSPGQKSAPADRAEGRRRRIALVGHLLHRNEGDATADLAELRRLISALGLEVVGALPEGGDWASVAKLGTADTVVSLPYARRAGQILAERTGAALVELALPVGLEATCDFVRQLGEATDRTAEAEDFLSGELARVMERLEWVVASELQGRRALVANDPHLAPALGAALTELGCQVVLELPLSRDKAMPELFAALDAHRPLERAADLAVVCSLAVNMLEDAARILPLVEVGFPAYYTHTLYPQPLLGFDGLLCLVSRLVTALHHATLRNP